MSNIEETRDLDVLRAEKVTTSVKVYDKREDLHDVRDKLTGTEKAFSSLKIENNQACRTCAAARRSSTLKEKLEIFYSWQIGRETRNSCLYM